MSRINECLQQNRSLSREGPGRRRGWAVLVMCLAVWVGGCQSSGQPEGEEQAGPTVAEAAVQTIALGAPLDDPNVEISGLTWRGDTLVVLPQYPTRDAPEGERRLWGLARSDLERFLAGDSAEPLQPMPIPLEAEGLGGHSAGYEGCEAIAFGDDRLFVLTESAGTGPGMTGHLIGGRVRPSRSGFSVEVPPVQKLPGQTTLRNMSYEALLVHGDTLVTLYEANGARVNPSASAYRFDADLNPDGRIRMPTLEYRLTDATTVDAAGRFWVINYLYAKENELLNPAPDSIALRHGVGRSHAGSDVVERLVEYRLAGDRIERTATPPIWLRLAGGTGRNWEGIARFGDGFLLATDRFPKTLLAYVEAPEEE